MYRSTIKGEGAEAEKSHDLIFNVTYVCCSWKNSPHQKQKREYKKFHTAVAVLRQTKLLCEIWKQWS